MGAAWAEKATDTAKGTMQQVHEGFEAVSLEINPRTGKMEVAAAKHENHVEGRGQSGPEARSKAMVLNGEVDRHKILRSDHEKESKTASAKAYLLSKGLYNAATWPKLGKTVEAAIHRAVIRPIREMIASLRLALFSRIEGKERARTWARTRAYRRHRRTVPR